MEIKKYLPIGSVVKVRNENQLLMIMGYLIKQGDFQGLGNYLVKNGLFDVKQLKNDLGVIIALLN